VAAKLLQLTNLIGPLSKTKNKNKIITLEAPQNIFFYGEM
jgi:hypothetical protein